MNLPQPADPQFSDETALDAARVIVDPHHHLWDHGSPFLLQEFLHAIATSGHKVLRTVFVECFSMYRSDGPRDLRPVGETEFVNGQAAMSASGRYGDCRVAAGIVGTANLRLGEDVLPILEAQVAAGNGRLRGLRFPLAHTDAGLFGRPANPAGRGILMEDGFRAGVKAMRRFGLSLDVWCLQPQLRELIDLATACPDTPIVLDHVGTPLKLDAHQQGSTQLFPRWRADIIELARRPNVVVKLGGLGMDVTVPIGTHVTRKPSTQLVHEWGPYIDTCIEAFGVQRCMFESNFPVDASTCTYGALWNAFKSIAASCTEAEKTALFSGTAIATYRLA